MFYLVLFIVVVGGYFLGNINFALIISGLNNRDIRKSDSGNPGAMNMFRNFGKKLGLLTLILDGVKGVLAAILGWFLLGSKLGAVDLPAEAFGFVALSSDLGGFFEFSPNHFGMFVGGFFAIIGHIFPVFLGFRGGKGIATSIGVCFVISPIVAPISLILGIFFLIFTKLGAITSFMIITPPLIAAGYSWAQGEGIGSIVVPSICACIFLLTLFRHRGNIKKLFLGTENKTILFKKSR